ncbi:outer membrane beta-barrel protein [Corallincola luteus]|nr:outer membrane beta-barrel protein [Corallincola luteus]
MLDTPKKLGLLAAICAGSYTAVVGAEGFEPAPIKLDSGMTLTPVLTTVVGYDDNVANSNSDEKDSMYTVISPRAKLEAGNDITNGTLDFGFDSGWYVDSSDDDYFDHSVSARGHHEFTAKYRLDLDASYRRTHDARGTGISEGNQGVFDDVTKYNYYVVGGVFGLGAQSSDLRFDLRSLYKKKDYRNFEDVTQYRDYDAVEVGATTYWNVMPKTDLLLDIGYEQIDYDVTDPSTISRDSDVFKALAGVEWDITGKTEGRASIGWQNKDFDDNGREDFDGVSWDVALTWKPKEYSALTFATGREARDPDTFGDYIKETYASASWRHKWLDRFSTEVGTKYVGESYTGVDRDDDYWRASLAAIYDFRRWLQFKGEYVWSDQDSNVDSVTYDKNVVYLSVKVAL